MSHEKDPETVRTGPSSSVGAPPPLEELGNKLAALGRQHPEAVSRIISPAAAMTEGILGNQPTQTITLAMRLEYAAVKSSPTGEVSKSQGGTSFSFEGGTPEDQVLRLMGAVAEWAKSIMGVEVDFQVKAGE